MEAILGKVVILGAQNVGKSSLVKKLLSRSDDNDEKAGAHTTATIGASFFTCTVRFDDEHLKKDLKLQIWDTAGQERFRSMAPMYYRNANAAIIVYDLTDYSTFEAAKTWVTELKRRVDNPIVMLLIGNKLDLSSQRAVCSEEVQKYCSHISALHHETSALTEQGLLDAFAHLATSLAEFENKLTYSNLVYKLTSETVVLDKSLGKTSIPKSTNLCCKP